MDIQTVAVTYSSFMYSSLDQALADIKRLALLFDLVYVFELIDSDGRTTRDWEYMALSLPNSRQQEFQAVLPRYLDELEWLKEQGIVQTTGNLTQVQSLIPRGMDQSNSALIEQYETEILDSLQQVVSLNRTKEGAKTKKRKALMEVVYQSGVRHQAAIIRLLGCDAYPVLHGSIKPIIDKQVTKSDILEIVLSSMPVPDGSVSWEQIIDYRNDLATRGHLIALRNWVNDISHAGLSLIELAQKLEYLRNEYEQHMQLHRMKINTGMFETIVTTTAEIVGDLMSLRWGQAAKALFALRHRQIALLEAEQVAPGREIAYIVQASEEFGS